MQLDVVARPFSVHSQSYPKNQQNLKSDLAEKITKAVMLYNDPTLTLTSASLRFTELYSALFPLTVKLRVVRKRTNIVQFLESTMKIDWPQQSSYILTHLEC